MARCGCAEFCGCSVRAGQNITITGEGTSASPWVIGVSTAFNTCADVMDCVGANVVRGIVYNANTRQLTVAYSAGSGNIATAGPDGGIFASVAVSDSPTAYMSGNGTTNAPLRVDVVAAALSGADAGVFAGRVALTFADGASSAAVAMTLPVDMFARVPVVQLCAHASTLFCGVAALSASSIQVDATRYEDTSTDGPVVVDVLVLATRAVVADPYASVDATGKAWIVQAGICHSDGCPNADTPVTITHSPGARILCGVCGQPITDLTS